MKDLSCERQYMGRMLADKCSSVEELLQNPDVDAQWLFHEAARFNLVDKMVELVDKYGADVNGMTQHPEPGSTVNSISEPALFAAAECGSVAAVEWLLEHGANPEIRSHPASDSVTPLQTAAEHGNVRGFQSALDSVTALWTAAEHGNVRVAYLLLDAGADVDTAKVSTGNTALFMAVQNGSQAMVTLLLRFGADVNKTKQPQGLGNVEPIVMAVGSARLPLVAQLINAGAKIPIHAISAFSQLRQSKMTCCRGYRKKVTDEELDLLEELLHVNSDLKNSRNYTKARVAERQGKYRKALRLLHTVLLHSPCAQLKFDIDRMVQAVYGVKGSDGRVSVWNQVPVMSRTRPESLQFYAWTQIGRKIYTHGGRDSSKVFMGPFLDEVWELDIDSREWSLLNTKGRTPGPREGHTMFAYKDDLYLWGGNCATALDNMFDSKLYRLKLTDDRDKGKFYTWEVVKLKSSRKPPPRFEHAGLLYKGKYYIMGGNFGCDRGLTDDMWCLDMFALKWTALKHGPKERHCHGMWAGRGKLFVYGGRTVERHIENPYLASHSIEDFVSYDIETKSWSSVQIVGDRPFDISEYTVLPLYHGDKQNEDEPSSIIVWGGYTEVDKSKGPPTEQNMKSMYGDAYRKFAVPYRNRLLRFDIETEAWTLLEATTDLLPKAQSFAAELDSANEQTKLLIGGGYGVTIESGVGIEAAEELPDAFRDFCKDMFSDYCKKWEIPDSENMHKPLASTNIYEVIIADHRDMCAVKDDLRGKSWAWKFYDLPGDILPSVRLDILPCSPTLHKVIDLTFEDVLKPPCESVRPNDDSTLLGVRVKLHELKGRKDLNGNVGRCGRWLADKERYQVFLPAHEPGGPSVLSVKPANLLVAKPWVVDDEADICNIVSKCDANGASRAFPRVAMTAMVALKAKMKRGPLDYIVNDPAFDGEWTSLMDTYHGPVSIKAQVILRTIAQSNAPFKSTLIWLCIPPNLLKSAMAKEKSAEMVRNYALFVDFYTKLKERDSLRVEKFESDFLKNRLKPSLVDSLGPWLKIDVALDGVYPPVQRELIVSPDITLQSLHHQVLCPAIGWTSNFHCYAFRRIHGFGASTPGDLKKGGMSKAIHDAAQMLAEECWIGPKKSTAIDSVFQPLYIGGALADDELILLGELFTLNEKSEMTLQYVHDFGDWWSHTIRISKYDGKAPSNTSVAHLLGGKGGCPPEDTGGIVNYAHKMCQLTGKMDLDTEDAVEKDDGSSSADPSSERWWELLNREVRGKLNGNTLSSPLDFDLETMRVKLGIAIRRPKQKVGKERINITQHDFKTGLSSELYDNTGVLSKAEKDPIKSCAICGVTVALKTCNGCKSIAFCCREHQLQYWPKHKKDCRHIQKERKNGGN